MSFLDSVQSGFSSLGDSIKHGYENVKSKVSGNSSSMTSSSVSMPVGGKYRSRKHKKGGKTRRCKKGGRKHRSKRPR